MKPVLLDTNAFAMVLTDDERLPIGAKETISKAPRAAISSITFYEIGQKARLGKWVEMEEFVPELVNIAIDSGIDLISMSPTTAVNASMLDWSHRDPFDRMIAAVALEEDANLISSDVAFDQLGAINRLWD